MVQEYVLIDVILTVDKNVVIRGILVRVRLSTYTWTDQRVSLTSYLEVVICMDMLL